MELQSYYIKDILKRVKRPITLNRDQDYKLVTVRCNHKGVCLREIKKGCEIKSNMYEVKSGDFILSGIDARNGAFGIIPAELDGAVVTNDFWIVEVDEQKIDKYFFLELTATNWFDEICKKGSDGTTHRMRLQKEKFFNQIIHLPNSKETQLLLLNKINFSKETHQKIQLEIAIQKETVSQLKQTVLQNAIQGKLTAEWRKEHPAEEPASELLKRIKLEKQQMIASGKLKKEKSLEPIKPEEIPFEIPEKWTWGRWGELSESIQYGYNAPAQENGRILMIRISDIQNNTIIWDKVPYCQIPENEINNYLIKKNDILFARTGGTVGKSYLVTDEPRSAIYAGYLIRTRYSSSLEPKFLKSFMESELYWSQLTNGTRGAAQPNCNGQTLSKMILPIPPLSEQQEIVRRIDAIMNTVNSLENQISESERTSEELLKAIVGEVMG